MLSQKKDHRYTVAIAAGLIYGLFLRILYHWPTSVLGPHRPETGLSLLFPNDLWVMTFGFLVLVPFTMGWITVSGTADDSDYHWSRWISTPSVAILVSNAFIMLMGVEGIICVVFAIPITLVMGGLGGISAGLATRSRFLNGRATTMCLAILPLLFSAVEMQLTGPLQLRTVTSSILIHAPAPKVWANIKSVPAIRPEELKPTWTHRIGFPLPVEATLDRDGIGGVRHASFQGGLLFVETIDAWEPNHRIGFMIVADTAHIPPTTLDEHVTIGGKYFDVLDGEYRLESMPNGDILLHLTSHERLNTDFNAYANLWSDAVMRDLQESILQVVKHRCEADAIQ